MNSQSHDLSPLRLPGRAAARHGLGIYFVVVLLLSVPLYVGMIRTGAFAGGNFGIAWLAPFMLVPTVASFVARALLREGFADLSRRRRTPTSRHMTRRALLLPVLVGGAAYSAAAASDLIAFELPSAPMWISLVAANLVLNIVLVPGEELGWRGYMVPRLVAGGIPAPLVVSGFIWGVWHVPLYLWAGIVEGGPNPIVQTTLMIILTTALGYILGRLQVTTGTVWAPVALHVAWNVTLQAGFDSLVTGADKFLWVGEIGLLTVALTTLAALGYSRRPWGLTTLGVVATQTKPPIPTTQRQTQP